MKKKLLFFFLLLTPILKAQTLESLRNGYYKVNTDSVACAKLYASVSGKTFTDNISKGYKGAVIAAMAGYGTDKALKLRLFREGKKLLEESIQAEPSNVELRFLRFTVQTNAPKALGYNKQVESDKKQIISNWGSIQNAGLKQKMQEYLSNSSYLSATEKQALKK